MVVLLASMVACRPCRKYYSPKILSATAKRKWNKQEASMEFFYHARTSEMLAGREWYVCRR
jgi:hypothetical protein